MLSTWTSVRPLIWSHKTFLSLNWEIYEGWNIQWIRNQLGGCNSFAEDTNLSGAWNATEGRDAVQWDLYKLKKGAHENLMKYNKAKCKLLCLNWCNLSRLQSVQNGRTTPQEHVRREGLGDLGG